MIGDLTYWLPWRKHLTDRFMPEPKWLPLLYHKPPFWYGYPFANLSAQKTIRLRQTMRENSWLVSLSGISNQAAGVSVRVLDVKRYRFWSQTFIDQSNFCGTGAYKFNLRIPQYIRKGNTVMLEVKNLATVAISGEIVIEAVQDVQLAN